MKTKLLATATGAALLLAPAGAIAATRASSSQGSVTTHPQEISRAAVDRQIRLRPANGFPHVTGSAQYQAQAGQRDFEVELEHLGTLTGRTLLVRVNGGTVGSMKVTRTGTARLTRTTERGQKVPVVVHGSSVTVKTRAGVVVASVKF
jgi:hypothetical protein